MGVALPPPAFLTAQPGKPLNQRVGLRINSCMAKGKEKAKGFTKELGPSCLGKEMENSVIGAGGTTLRQPPSLMRITALCATTVTSPQGAWELSGSFISCPFLGTQRQLPSPA